MIIPLNIYKNHHFRKVSFTLHWNLLFGEYTNEIVTVPK